MTNLETLPTRTVRALLRQRLHELATREYTLELCRRVGEPAYRVQLAQGAADCRRVLTARGESWEVQA